ncbi:AAA family ATPase [Micromonospora soli]|uniref:AAA family ATPase n=1 Tax=Micromonospora sp. NBRC 110009 TaxID=3061627 RepID=UPI0026710F12|nr:AAA family ATPase [Micromonospora sp. NBRC 110009]WKT96902.1 AAA family ATPase [Micromonospora sp. NBRC 110009]
MPRASLQPHEVLEIREALFNYYTFNQLRDVVRRLDVDLRRLEKENATLPDFARDVVETADRQGWLMPLLAATAHIDPLIGAHLERLAKAQADAGPSPGERGNHLVVAVAHAPQDAALADELERYLERSALPVQPLRGGGADVLVFLATEHAIGEASPCRAKVEDAVTRGLDVIAVVADSAAPRSGWAAGLDPVDGRDGWVGLGRRLREAASPRRQLRKLVSRRDAVERGRAGADTAEADRINAELRELHELIAQVSLRLDGHRPEPAPAQPLDVPGPADDDLAYAGEPLAADHSTFHDRQPYLDELERLLSEPDQRMIFLQGRSGVGKTGVVARLLAERRAGLRAPFLRGFVYLPAFGFRPVNAAAVVSAIARMVRGREQARLVVNAQRLKQPWLDVLDHALDGLADCPVLLVIDDADELFGEDGRFQDEELRDVVDRLRQRRDHGVRILLVGQPIGPVPESFELSLDEGLPEPHDLRFLQALDTEGLLHLNDVPTLTYLCRLVDGSPRALELVFALLSQDSRRSIEDQIHDLEQISGDPSGAVLKKVFLQLDIEDKRILQALAIYARPVKPAAVDELLGDYVPGIGSAHRLLRLHRLRLVRRDDQGRFYLPPRNDRAIVLNTLAEGGCDDVAASSGLLTQVALYHRAAEHFERHRTPAEKIGGVGDLDNHLAEIDMRIAAGEYSTALHLADDLNRFYLMRWGHGVLVERPLTRLEGRLTDRDEYFRLCALAWIAGQQRRPERVIEHAAAAQRLAGSRKAVARLLTTVGKAHFDQDRLDEAANLHRQALRRIPMVLVPSGGIIRAAAQIGIASVLTRAADFTGALDHYEKARRNLPRSLDGAGSDAALLLVLDAAGRGIIRTHLGDYTGAARDLGRARHLAELAGLEIELGEGHLHDAQLLIVQERWDEAETAADRAARSADETGSRMLRRDAREVSSLIALCRGELKQAADTIRVAVRHDPTADGLALKGMIDFRSGDLPAARSAFKEGLRLVPEPPADGYPDYQLMDARGLILTGLAVCDDLTSDLIDQAADAYRQARRVTAAKGAVARVALRLKQLETDSVSIPERLWAAAQIPSQ